MKTDTLTREQVALAVFTKNYELHLDRYNNLEKNPLFIEWMRNMMQSSWKVAEIWEEERAGQSRLEWMNRHPRTNV